ncbi:glycoside hydrolase family 2 TIM barrel-domain containing protein [Arcanobacterium hippocoleae]
MHGEGNYLWSPEYPNLFEVTLELTDGESQNIIDTVHTYFGLRKIEAKNGMIYLNNRPYYQKLVLDQGYWPQGLLTAAHDDDYRKDIELAKAMGFNGCRKHQKLEDPRFLYWADTLGFLVWEEGSSAPLFSPRSVQRVSQEWTEIIQRDKSHPSIIVWVPLNESWGVPSINNSSSQQHYSQALYHLVKSLDSTRLVDSNDGWEQTVTDICAVHNYCHGEVGDIKQYAEFAHSISDAHALVNYSLNGREIFASGFSYMGQPIILSECGGIASAEDTDGWGYTTVATAEAFLEEYRRLIGAIYSSQSLWGFCYTQLTDVEQEKNGLLNYDRQPKCSLEELKKINTAHHPHSLGR